LEYSYDILSKRQPGIVKRNLLHERKTCSSHDLINLKYLMGTIDTVFTM